MKMYQKNRMSKSTINRNDSTEGETIEQKIERVVNNGEPITDGAPIIYTERKDGVMPGYDIRTDRFDVAIDGMDKVSKTHIAKRENDIKTRKEALEELNKPKKVDGGAEPTQGKQSTKE